MANVLLQSLLLVLMVFGVTVTSYQVGDACDVGDPEDNTGQYEAHPTNCGQYLQCLHSEFVARDCSEGLHWSVEDGACQWPQKANCVQLADFVQRDEVGGLCDVGDHEDNTGLYRPHPTNCESYLQCLHGEFTERSCPPGLHWSEEDTACQWPDKANCVNRGVNFVGVVGGVGYIPDHQVYPVPPVPRS